MGIYTCVVCDTICRMVVTGVTINYVPVISLACDMVVVYNLQHGGTHKSDDTHKGTEQQLN